MDWSALIYATNPEARATYKKVFFREQFPQFVTISSGYTLQIGQASFLGLKQRLTSYLEIANYTRLYLLTSTNYIDTNN